MKFIDQISLLIETASSKGSDVNKLLLPPSSLQDVSKWEKEFKFKFSSEIFDYAQILGHGIKKPVVHSDDGYLAELIPSFSIIDFDNSVVFTRIKEFANSILDKKHKNNFISNWIVPFMWNGVDFISFCKTKENITGVIVKRNGYGIPSEIWVSALYFFEFHTKCWLHGIYKTNKHTKIVDSDSNLMFELMSDYEAKKYLFVKMDHDN